MLLARLLTLARPAGAARPLRAPASAARRAMAPPAAAPRAAGDAAEPAEPAAAAGPSGLAAQRCVPCEGAGGPPALAPATATALLARLGPAGGGWALAGAPRRLARTWTTGNFKKGLELCRRFGDVAEAEGHHPDLHLESWNQVRVEVWTHAAGGLTENDFVLAAKLDAVEKSDLLRKKKSAAAAAAAPEAAA
jgi:4a-hydroxytetrahydrobiopterin dehydratase